VSLTLQRISLARSGPINGNVFGAPDGRVRGRVAGWLRERTPGPARPSGPVRAPRDHAAFADRARPRTRLGFATLAWIREGRAGREKDQAFARTPSGTRARTPRSRRVLSDQSCVLPVAVDVGFQRVDPLRMPPDLPARPNLVHDPYRERMRRPASRGRRPDGALVAGLGAYPDTGRSLLRTASPPSEGPSALDG
jgi:hypothetical protein